MQILVVDDGRIVQRDRLKELPPRGERLLPRGYQVRFDPEQRQQPRGQREMAEVIGAQLQLEAI